MRGVAIGAGIALGLFCLILNSTPSLAKQHKFAIIVGNNKSQSEGLEDLRFADDDAVKYYELFSHICDQVVLLTQLDEESKALYPDLQPVPPTRQNVLEKIEEVVGEAEAVYTQTRQLPIIYFVFTGHGEFDQEGRGFLHLQDGYFTTRDLYYYLISRSDDFYLFLVVDACNAGHLVQSRGGGERRKAGPPTLELEKYENVGLVLASSATGEVKEWARLLSGIFSHEVRSASLGAADVDLDGKVLFQEVAAFVHAANEKIVNPALKLKPYIRPPLSNPKLPFVDWAEHKPSRVLIIQSERDQRYSLFDSRLVRYADFALKRGQTVQIALLKEKEVYYVRSGEFEYQVPAKAEGEIFLSTLEREYVPLAARGVDKLYSQHLFSVALDIDYARKYLTGQYPNELVVTRKFEKPWWENKNAWALSGFAALAFGSAAWLTYKAYQYSDKASDARWADVRESLNQKIKQYNTFAWIAGTVGSAALSGAVALFIFDRDWVEESFAPKIPPGIRLNAQGK